jgi:hypothetical protein
MAMVGALKTLDEGSKIEKIPICCVFFLSCFVVSHVVGVRRFLLKLCQQTQDVLCDYSSFAFCLYNHHLYAFVFCSPSQIITIHYQYSFSPTFFATTIM